MLNCYGYYRSRRSLPSSSCRQPQEPQVEVDGVLFYRRYATTTRRRRRPVADSEAQSNRRRLHHVADLMVPTTCRHRRHVTDDTVSCRHVATHRSVRYRLPAVNDDNLVPTQRASDAAWLRCIFLVVC